MGKHERSLGRHCRQNLNSFFRISSIIDLLRSEIEKRRRPCRTKLRQGHRLGMKIDTLAKKTDKRSDPNQTKKVMSMLKRVSICTVALACTAGVYAASAIGFGDSYRESEQGEIPLLGKRDQSFLSDKTEDAREVENKRYQIGDEWGKKLVVSKDLANESKEYQRAAKATAKAGGATSFYLGKFAGKHVMATNHHVFPRPSKCLGGTIRFPLAEKSFKCDGFLGTWPSIDLALFTLDAPGAEDDAFFKPLEGNFDFEASLPQGEALLTVGFGVGNNPTQKLVGNEDSDCKVFSEASDFRLMGDPDSLNPADYKAWSFVNGCDVSHGDSGSALVSKQTGRPVGIIWTGKIPKDPRVQSTAFLNELLSADSPLVWSELSFGVPAPKIKEQLEDVIQSPLTPQETKKILIEVIAQ